MKYCRKCLQPDTRPDIKFNREGVCYACIYELEKKTINWSERELQLKQIADWAKQKSKGSTYDCVIGVSGGKDSMFQAYYAKEKLGLNTLLVNSVPDSITEIGKYNIEQLVNGGFDMIQMRPNPKIMKELTRQSFFKYGNISKPSEYSLWASAYIIAIKFNIPLVIQGENAALTLGVDNGLGKGDNALNVNEGNTLAGGNAEDWVSDEISFNELFMYQFPDKQEFINKGLKAIYLQYYVKEWSQVGNADFAIARGLRGRMLEDLYDLGRYRRFSCLDSNLHIVNQMLKYYKFGFGFATDEACYDIREARLSREDAIWYVNQFDGKCGEQYIEEFCQYINISIAEFWKVIEQFVNKKLFYKDTETHRWLPKFTVGVDFEL